MEHSSHRRTRGPAAIAALGMLAAVLASACGSNVSPSPNGTGPAPTAPASAAPSGSPAPGGSAEPGPSAQPASGPRSSQALIAADLAAGTIDAATALRYRAWALFWDPRLPERYDGIGSTGEDNELFDDIAALLPTLSGAVRDELAAYLLRPTDPRSPFSGGGATARGGVTTTFGRAAPAAAGVPARLAAASAAPTQSPVLCESSILDLQWRTKAWSPDGDVNHGFRAWVCAVSDQAAQADLDKVLAVGAKLWPAMTVAEPNGMGLPVPDTGAPQSDGDGKVDVYVLGSFAQCRQRGTLCRQIEGDGVAAAGKDIPYYCGVAGFPAKACSAYMLVAQNRLNGPTFAGDFAHEFFHVLQYAHNARRIPSWYDEASATWAEWHYVVLGGGFSGLEEGATLSNLDALTRAYQAAGASLLRYERVGIPYQYLAWLWPLFQDIEKGPSAVFRSWSAIEGTTDVAEFDAAIDSQLPFADRFRDFAVRNAQPRVYEPPASTGLDTDRWQTKPNLAGFPDDQHRIAGSISFLPLGPLQRTATIEALDAQYEMFQVSDPGIRQIEIDIGTLTGVSHAHLDVLGRRLPTGGGPADTWRRFRVSGTSLVLCRDKPDENVDFIEIVISNHAVGRAPSEDDPDPRLQVKGDYTIESKDACGAPDHYTGTISGSNSRGDSWHGTATFDRIRHGDPDDECWPTDYCYRLVSAQGSWTCRSGATVGFTAAPPIESGGLVLTMVNEQFPDRARTYGGLIDADEKDTCPDPPYPAPRVADLTVIAWLSIGDAPLPKIAHDWRLADSRTISGCGIEGDCGSQTWTWDLRPIFDP